MTNSDALVCMHKNKKLPDNVVYEQLTQLGECSIDNGKLTRNMTENKDWMGAIFNLIFRTSNESLRELVVYTLSRKIERCERQDPTEFFKLFCRINNVIKLRIFDKCFAPLMFIMNACVMNNAESQVMARHSGLLSTFKDYVKNKLNNLSQLQNKDDCERFQCVVQSITLCITYPQNHYNQSCCADLYECIVNSLPNINDEVIFDTLTQLISAITFNHPKNKTAAARAKVLLVLMKSLIRIKLNRAKQSTSNMNTLFLGCLSKTISAVGIMVSKSRENTQHVMDSGFFAVLNEIIADTVLSSNIVIHIFVLILYCIESLSEIRESILESGILTTLQHFAFSQKTSFVLSLLLELNEICRRCEMHSSVIDDNSSYKMLQLLANESDLIEHEQSGIWEKLFSFDELKRLPEDSLSDRINRYFEKSNGISLLRSISSSTMQRKRSAGETSGFDLSDIRSEEINNSLSSRIDFLNEKSLCTDNHILSINFDHITAKKPRENEYVSFSNNLAECDDSCDDNSSLYTISDYHCEYAKVMPHIIERSGCSKNSHHNNGDLLDCCLCAPPMHNRVLTSRTVIEEAKAADNLCFIHSLLVKFY